MRAPVVRRHDLDVECVVAAFDVVLNTHVGELHMPLVVARQAVVDGPLLDLFDFAIGATIAPAMAAIANSLFRMGNSFARRAPAFASAVDAGQFIACGIVPENRGLIRGISGELLRRLEPIEVVGVLLFRNRASG